MALEVVGALLIGALVLWLVFSPMLSRGPEVLLPPEPVADEETRSGIALLALKEIEFDRATGKLSDGDYETLKTRYGAEALSALDQDRSEWVGEAACTDPETMIAARLQQLRSAHGAGTLAPPPCSTCGPRPEPDALFCSSCGRALGPAFCVSCGSALDADSRFCSACGSGV
jgi:RNA polymerase subunit RPABC4/transcription elongation factor Spt4